MKKWMFFTTYYTSPKLLVHAAAHGRVEDIKECLRDGHSVDSAASYDHIKGSALYHAARRGKLEAVAALIEAGAKVDFGGPIGVTPFWQACAKGHLEVAQMLLDHGADINAVGGVRLSTPLHVAAREGNAKVVKFLLERGANPSLWDAAGKTARYMAVENGNRETIDALRAAKKMTPPPEQLKRMKLFAPK